MQAFLWRHPVPATELPAMVFNPSAQSPPKRTAPALPPAVTDTSATPTNAVAGDKPRFTKQQIAYRLRQLKLLYEEDLLTDSFYLAKAAECEAGR